MMKKFRLLAVLAATAAVLSGTFSLPATAQANTTSAALVSCNSLESIVRYNPGLNLELRQRKVTGVDKYLCLALSPGLLTTAEGRVEGTATTSCAGASTGARIQERVQFHRDGVSVIDYTTVVAVRGLVTTAVTHLGRVTSGPFRGAQAVKVIDFLNTQFLACATERGVEEIRGVGTLELIG